MPIAGRLRLSTRLQPTLLSAAHIVGGRAFVVRLAADWSLHGPALLLGSGSSCGQSKPPRSKLRGIASGKVSIGGGSPQTPAGHSSP